MYIIYKTSDFDKWLRKLRDLKAKAIILFRIQKIEEDEHFGDCKHVGDGIRELKIDYAKDIEYILKNQMGKLLFYSLVEKNQLSRKT